MHFAICLHGYFDDVIDNIRIEGRVYLNPPQILPGFVECRWTLSKLLDLVFNSFGKRGSSNTQQKLFYCLFLWFRDLAVCVCYAKADGNQRNQEFFKASIFAELGGRLLHIICGLVSFSCSLCSFRLGFIQFFTVVGSCGANRGSGTQGNDCCQYEPNSYGYRH